MKIYFEAGIRPRSRYKLLWICTGSRLISNFELRLCDLEVDQFLGFKKFFLKDFR